MASRCKGTTKAGAPCQAPPVSGSDYCYTHDPDLEQERADSRRRGGLSLHYGSSGKPSGEPIELRTADDVLKLLETATADIMGRKPSLQRAKALVYVASVARQAVETSDLAARITALEESQRPRGVA